MICLALDTAGPFCSAAVLANGTATVEAERIERGHAERLMPMIGEILRRAGIAYPDIGRIGVTVGPGSYPGVRIGLAAARGLGFALDIEVCGFGVLDTLLAEAGAPGACAVMDAGRGAVFAAIEGRMPATLTSLSDLSGHIAEQPRDPVLIGSAAPQLATGLGRGLVLRAAEAVDIAWLARVTAAGKGARAPRPLYLRPPDAKRPARRTLVRRSG